MIWTRSNSSCTAVAPRRTSINEDLLRRRFSSSLEAAVHDGNSSSQLESESEPLITTTSNCNGDAINDDDHIRISAYDKTQSKQNNPHHNYGAVAEIEPHHSFNDEEAVVYIEQNYQENDQQNYYRRLSFTKDKDLLKDEMKSMIELSIPVCLTYLLEMLPGVTTTILVGRMNNGQKLQMDAAALAVMMYNITAMSPGMGLLTAMDTLCSQAHGANQPSKMGKYLLTGMFVMMIAFGIVVCIIWNTTPLLLMFGQHENVAREAGIFSMYMLPGIPFVYTYEMLRKISQARNEATPMIISTIMSNVVNVGFGYYLVNFTSWGWLGAAVARTVGSMSMLPALILSMMYSERSQRQLISNNDEDDIENKDGLDGRLFQHLWEGFEPRQALTSKAVFRFLDLGIPGMFQVMLEWVAFEVIALLCGIIPDPEEALIAIGSNAIVLNVSTFIFMTYLGIGVAGNVRIGNALGAGDAHRAEVATYLAVAISLLLSFINITVLVTFRESIASIFTTDEDLLDKCRNVFIIVAIYQLPDALNGVEQGVFRASGRQSLGAKLNIVAYYVFGIPLGYFLALPLGMGVEGFWIGICVGLIVISTAGSIIIWRSDWAALAVDARSRLSVTTTSKDLLLP